MNDIKMWFTLISLILSILLTILKIVETFIKLPAPIKKFLSKPLLPWGLVVLLLFLGVAFLPQFITKQTENENMPLELYRSYNFENVKGPTDTAPWVSYPISQTHMSLISDDIAYAHSGTNSYQLIMDTQPYQSNPDTEYASIGITNKNLTNITMISAWVFIPYAEPILNHNFQAHILAFRYDEYGNPVSFISRDTKIELGKWTRLSLGTFQNSNAIPDFTWNGNIDELYISIWCEQTYSGSIFIDDVSFYK